jgi:hypothetical protein
VNLRFREPRVKNEKHLKFIRGLPCCVCLNNIETEAAHIRFQCLEVGKRQTGKQEKPDDRWTLPLCGTHHRDQHRLNEKVFWYTIGIDPIKTARLLWEASGDQDAGERIVIDAIRYTQTGDQRG